MALRADRRLMPSADTVPEGDPPISLAGANLFAPISTANRITGQSRASRLHTRENHLREQLASGSSYDYGRGGEEPLPTAPAFSADAYTASFNPGAFTLTFERVPPTFLHRTMDASAEATDTPSPFGYGIARMTAPEAQRETGAGGAPVDRPDFSADAQCFGNAPEAAVYRSGLPLPETAAYGAGKPPASAAQDADATPGEGWMPAGPLGDAPSPYQGIPIQNEYPPPEGAPNNGRRAARRVRNPAGQGYGAPPAADRPYAPVAQAAAAPDNDALVYVPRHGGGSAARAAAPATQPPVPAPAADVWQMLGWKETQPDSEHNTAVWRVSDLTMFERAVFSDPLDPLRNPPEAPAVGAPYGQSGAAMPGDTSGGFAPPAYPQNGSPSGAYAAYPQNGNPSGAYAAYPQNGSPSGAYAAYPPETWDSQTYPAQPEEYPSGAATGAWQDTPRNARAPRGTPADAQESKPLRETLGKITPGRLILYVALSLALLFCLIEGAKIVRSLWQAEHTPNGFTEEYGQLTGGGDMGQANGVELLPAGVTYAPTASPVPANTATPTPRISQYDPLIGVVDAGGAQVTSAIPTPTSVTRTRLTAYPDNALLAVGDAFTALLQENKDVVARLTIDGLVDETVVQRNNTFYLNHNARGASAATGAVFMDEGCQIKKPPENLLLRAQANTEGKMFSPLLQYEKGGTAFLTQHGIVRCDTLYEQAQYVIFAILHADSVVGSADYFNYAGYPTFPSDALMMSYVQAAKSKSLYRIEVGVRSGDRLLTLATVSEGSDTSSLVILCRKLREGESATGIARD